MTYGLKISDVYTHPHPFKGMITLDIPSDGRFMRPPGPPILKSVCFSLRIFCAINPIPTLLKG